MNEAQKRRSDRLAKQRLRNSERSYVTEVEDLQIMLAWESGQLSEGQAMKALGTSRIDARRMKQQATAKGCELGESLFDQNSKTK